MIQFSLKSVTKYLNFSLTICVYWHCSKYTFSTQCLSSNMKSTIDGFIYRHVSRSVLTTFTSCIFTISITKYWTDNNEAAIDCTNAQYRASFDESLPHNAQGNVVILVVANYNFDKRHTSHDDSDIQVFIRCTTLLPPFSYRWL